MAEPTVPYLNASGNITMVLERIKTAQLPARFTTNFLETTLTLSGGALVR